MLTRRGGMPALLALVFLAMTVPSARADSGGGVTCPPDLPACIVVVTDPGAPGTGGTGPTDPPGTRVCKVPSTGAVTPCYDPTFGWWSNIDGCYFKVVEPPPPPTDSAWNGHYPSGRVYQTTCLGSPGSGGGWVWLADNPDGYGGVAASPATLAQRAVDLMRLAGPDIGMAPGAGKTGLVGLPVWLWTAVSASTWGPTSATASVPGVSVTARAEATRIVWDMGDGHSVTCTGPGTPYTTSQGDSRSPTCGHVYAVSSAAQPNHAYTVTATTTWSVTWTGGGQSGALSVTRTSTTQVRIGELQVLVS